VVAVDADQFPLGPVQWIVLVDAIGYVTETVRGAVPLDAMHRMVTAAL
jgi:hypothetical protein